MISIIIPTYNEEKNVKILAEEIKSAVNQLNQDYEIIFINDGSTDNTLNELKKIPEIKIISFKRNYGQTAGLQAGFDLAQGEIIISLDADGQNDPNDIPNLIEKLNSGYDVVCGWRYQRNDSFFKTFVSQGANFLRKILVKDNIHDSGCTLRAYRSEAAKSLELTGELHRFIPALAQLNGFKVTEIKVNHRPRVAGKTKYNFSRILKGFMDILGVWFWRKYASRPLHLFGGMGLVAIFLGCSGGFILFILRVFGILYLSNRIWPLIIVLLMLSGIQFLVLGILADISIKGFNKVNNKKPYQIKEVINNFGDYSANRIKSDKI